MLEVDYWRELLSNEANQRAFAVVSALLGAAWIAYWTLRPKASLKRDMELAGSARGAGLEVPDGFRKDLHRRSKNLLEPYPRVIGFPHLLTFGLGALWVRYAFDAEAWWWIRVVVGTFGVFVLGVGLGDILWCRWHKFRFSRIGVFVDRRFSLIGEGERGEARRHIAVLERDQELGRLPAGAVLNYDADGNRLDHTRSTPDA